MKNHNAIVDAFKKVDGQIKTCHKGGKPGYTHIHGPSCAPTHPRCHNHPLLVECLTGTVGFREELGQSLQGPLGNMPKAKMQRDIKIQDHPLGRSSGKIGRYNYVFSSDMILDGWGNYDRFAQDVVNQCKALDIW